MHTCSITSLDSAAALFYYIIIQKQGQLMSISVASTVSNFMTLLADGVK